MKPCRRNRKPITWLALDALEASTSRKLRAHLETCEGCRAYLEEITVITRKLNAAEPEPDIQATNSFHQKVLEALTAEKRKAGWPTICDTIFAPLALRALRWRVPLSMVGTAALFVAIVSLAIRERTPLAPRPRMAQATSPTPTPNDLAPTFFNYQVVADRSLEGLDDLLTRQANLPPPPIAIYTASTQAAENERN